MTNTLGQLLYVPSCIVFTIWNGQDFLDTYFKELYACTDKGGKSDTNVSYRTWFLNKMVAHFTMRTYGVNQAIDYWRHLVTSKESSNLKFFFLGKDPVTLYVCTMFWATIFYTYGQYGRRYDGMIMLGFDRTLWPEIFFRPEQYYPVTGYPLQVCPKNSGEIGRTITGFFSDTGYVINYWPCDSVFLSSLSCLWICPT